MAQVRSAVWGTPVNLSNSAAASDPLLVRGADDVLYAYWWDRFDGVTVSYYERGRWTTPAVVPIYVPRTVKGEPAIDQQTGLQYVDVLKTRPTLTAGANGRVYALWSSMAASSGDYPVLLMSKLLVGDTTWSAPQILTPSVTAWKLVSSPTGALDLVYFEPARLPGGPPGVYHGRSVDGAVTWSRRSLITAAPSVRLVTEAEAHIDAAADDVGHVYATWDDPRTGVSSFAVSNDAGVSWTVLDDAALASRSPARGRVAVARNGVALRLWEAAHADPLAGPYQQRTTDGGQTWTSPERVWPGYALDDLSFFPLSAGRILSVTGSVTNAPVVGLWDLEQAQAHKTSGWSDIVNAEIAGSVDLPAVSGWCIDQSADVLTAMGVGADGDVWAIRHLGTIDWTYPLLLPARSSATTALLAPAGWTEPVALSPAGMAAPIIVGGDDGRFQAFWWDPSAGVATAFYDGAQWSPPAAAPIPAYSVPKEDGAAEPLMALPQIVSDGQVNVHALWLTEPGAARRRALLHARLSLSSTVWSAASEVASDVAGWAVATDVPGRVDLLVVRNIPAEGVVRGELAYTHTLPGGVSWMPLQTVLYASDDELPLADGATLSLAAESGGGLVAAWSDPVTHTLRVCTSGDGGQTWSAPVLIQDPVHLPYDPHVVWLGGSSFALLWQSADRMAPAGWYQQLSVDGGQSWGEPARVLPVDSPAGDLRLLGSSAGLPVIAVGYGGDSLGLSAWNQALASSTEGAGWSQVKSLGLGVLGLEDQGAAVSKEQVAVIGLDATSGVVWALQRPMGDRKWLVDLPAPWSQPERVSTAMAVGRAALVSDADSHFYAMWSERRAGRPPVLQCTRFDGSRWSSPATVLFSDAGALEPSLAVAGDRLHAVWRDDAGTAIYHSAAFVRDAYSAGAWDDPVALPLPAEAQSLVSPRITADALGNLHAVYAVPFNEGRGVYYTWSTDGGATWSPPKTVFSARDAGWPQVAAPAIAVDTDGTIFVAWERAVPTALDASQGVALAFSTDEGQTWAQPESPREGAFAQPLLVLSKPGAIHWLWRDSSSDIWWHAFSSDGGRSWGEPGEIRGTHGLVGSIGLVSNANGWLQLIGVGETVNGPCLLSIVWDDDTGQWERSDGLLLSDLQLGTEGAAAALMPLNGRLVVLVEGSLVSEGTTESTGTEGWLYMTRQVAAVSALPGPAVVPTLVPVPTATLVPTVTPGPVFGRAAPTEAPLGSSLDLGITRLPLLALAGIAAAAVAMVFVVAVKIRPKG